MLYIISPINLDGLKKYNIPKKGMFGTPDWYQFLTSEEGKEFFDISPMRIIQVENQKQLIFRLSTDVSFLSMCYNCPLYIYIMDNKTYKRVLNYKIKSHFNMGKVQQLLSDNKKLAEKAKIDPSTTYYNSDDNVITEELTKTLKGVKSNNIEIYLTKEKGFEVTKSVL